MTTVNIRRVGGSLMVALPKKLIEPLQLGEGGEVDVQLVNDHLEIRQAVPHYTLKELLAQCDYSAVPTDEVDSEWTGGTAAGREII